MNFDYVINLTIPQIRILEKNLYKICKAEAGEEAEVKPEEKDETTRAAMGYTIKRLQKETGKDSFTMQEVLNPDQTIAKYKKV